MAEELKSANSARPESLSSPVPLKDAFAEAAQAYNQKIDVPESDAFSLAAQKSVQQDQGFNIPAPPSGTATQTLETIGRIADYPGGFARAAAFDAAGLATGNPNLVTDEDIKNAAKGKGPNSAEYLRRMGVSDGGSLTLPGLGKVTLRGAEGLALDIATDPLTVISKLVKEVPLLGKLLNSTDEGAQVLGELTYRSALPKATQKFTSAERDVAAKTLIESGAPMLTKASSPEKINIVADALGRSRQLLYDKVTQAGAQVELNNFKNTEAVLKRYAENPSPNMKALAENLTQELEAYKAAKAAPIDKVSQWKTDLYNTLPDSAFSNGKLKGIAKEFKGALASDLRNMIVQTGNKVEKGLGHSIDTVNNKWGALLSAQNPAVKAAGAGGTLGHLIDGAVISAGGAHGYVAKKGFDLATGAAARTAVGKALMAAGREGLANRLASRTIIDNPPVVQNITGAADKIINSLNPSLPQEETP